MQLLISEDLIDLGRLAAKYHYRDEDIEQLTALWREVLFCISKSAQATGYDIVENGGAYTTAVGVCHRSITRNEYSRLPLEQAELMAMTLGREVDARQEIYLKHENLTAAYMMECICSEVLLSLYQELNNQYAEQYGCYIKRYHFIGEKISLEEMPKILELLEQDQITCNRYGVLMPKKSVVFFAETTNQQKEECRGICQYCTRTDCSNRSGEGFHLTYGFQKIFQKR